jgi:glutathione S-transferase
MTRRPFLISGAIGSPYTRKLKALLIYRRIPYRFLVAAMPGESPRPDLPKPPLPLLPCLFFPEADGDYRAGSDTTFLIRELESLHQERSVIPADTALAFLSSLIEDYADEWVTKQMFHYRWGVEEGVDHACNMLPLWNLGFPDSMLPQFKKTFAQRQIDRLSGVVAGSVEVAGPIIEASYKRLIAILRERLEQTLFLFGSRPSAADFALYGQLTQLMQVEPTSMSIARESAPRVMAWVDAMDDLSGLTVDEAGGWSARDELGEDFKALLSEIGRTYAPFMVANSTALETGQDRVSCAIDGREYWQKPFRYQQKCLGWLREEYAKLEAGDRTFVDGMLAETGCEVLFGG